MILQRNLLCIVADQCAIQYETEMKRLFPNSQWPSFDLLLLGLGPDGHTCSLFPGHPALKERDRWIVSVTDSPKPPPNRVSMTIPVIKHAKSVAFITPGRGKAEILKVRCVLIYILIF